jgi:DNA-directed RNA polymerase subunit beta
VIVHRYWPRIGELLEEQERKIAQMKRGDELPSGVLEMVKVYIATKRRCRRATRWPVATATRG